MKCKIDRLPPALRMFSLRSKCLHRYQEHTEESNSEDHETSDDEASSEESNAEEHEYRTRSRQLFISDMCLCPPIAHCCDLQTSVVSDVPWTENNISESTHQRFPVSATILTYRISCLFYDSAVLFLMQTRILYFRNDNVCYHQHLAGFGKISSTQTPLDPFFVICICENKSVYGYLKYFPQHSQHSGR